MAFTQHQERSSSGCMFCSARTTVGTTDCCSKCLVTGPCKLCDAESGGRHLFEGPLCTVCARRHVQSQASRGVRVIRHPVYPYYIPPFAPSTIEMLLGAELFARYSKFLDTPKDPNSKPRAVSPPAPRIAHCGVCNTDYNVMARGIWFRNVCASCTHGPCRNCNIPVDRSGRPGPFCVGCTSALLEQEILACRVPALEPYGVDPRTGNRMILANADVLRYVSSDMFKRYQELLNKNGLPGGGSILPAVNLSIPLDQQREFLGHGRTSRTHHQGGVRHEASSTSRFTCGICQESHSMNQMAPTPCHHPLCRECFAGHVNAKLEARNWPVTCPFDHNPMRRSCPAYTSAMIHSLELPLQAKKFMKEAQILATGNVPIQCRFCMTEILIHGQDAKTAKFLSCEACKNQWCVECSLAVKSKSRHKCTATGIENLIASEGINNCPGCGLAIQKAGGCNHMKCTSCQTHFCNLCGGAFRMRGNWGLQEAIDRHMRDNHIREPVAS
ncbi:hypothetical protein DL96DRAFT_1575901 [Flagelloscypha sp. PMI_526]|nr:hypothetical protein DL96DRAFT_1575901 [Flagelloscypha sp. PMI_526]